MDIEDKLTILADAAKYDVSCASSGSRRKNTSRQLGKAASSGICHTYTEDGRCVSLVKILLTNMCIYNCAYCVNRCSNDVPRAAFTTREIVSLTIDFYRRNYIEGLFLSSGVIHSPDDTMERLVRTVQMLRGQRFNGYIHLKCVPFASRRLIQQAGYHADQRWIIYDNRRNCGLAYDGRNTHALQVDVAALRASCRNDHEQLCQTLWQRYYAAVNVQARNNPRLHLSKLPRRYWRYLTEKRPIMKKYSVKSEKENMPSDRA